MHDIQFNCLPGHSFRQEIFKGYLLDLLKKGLIREVQISAKRVTYEITADGTQILEYGRQMRKLFGDELIG